jgi:hypothetical protein
VTWRNHTEKAGTPPFEGGALDDTSVFQTKGQYEVSLCPESRLQSILDRPCHGDTSLEYRWSTGKNIAALALAGDDEWFVVSRRKRRTDGAIRGVLYHVDAHSRFDQVEILGTYRSMLRAQLKGEELADHGGFSIDPISFLDQPWQSTTRIPASLIRKLDLHDLEHRRGLTLVEATDMFAISYVTRLLREFHAGRRP